jgi:hypothetical protein
LFQIVVFAELIEMVRLLRHSTPRKDKEKVTRDDGRGECLAMAKERVIN